MKFIYPAIFTKEDDGGYSVRFPDFKGGFTDGNDLKEAFASAEDCLGGLLFAYEEEKREFPTASKISSFPQNSEMEFTNLIKIDLSEYKRLVSEKPVKKTLYIPKRLNDAAEAKGLNFSQVLRDALSQQLV